MYKYLSLFAVLHLRFSLLAVGQNAAASIFADEFLVIRGVDAHKLFEIVFMHETLMKRPESITTLT